MHFKNGREAKVGDMILGRNFDGTPISGVIVTTQAQSDTCNLTVMPITPGSRVTMTAKECLHVDDAMSVGDPAIGRTA